jgi:hypothetical protein
VRAVGGRAGVTIGPCPFFYPEGSPCWGGANGRYHLWQRNMSNACQGSSGGACPFDAVIVHNYVCDVKLLAKFEQSQHLAVFLAVPQVTMDFGAQSMKRDFADGLRLWVTEYNTMFAGVWGGKADATSPAAARFLNRTANSAAHAVHVAAYIMAAMSHGTLFEMLNYHSFLEGAGPTSLGPQTTGGSQPGFATAAINDSGQCNATLHSRPSTVPVLSFCCFCCRSTKAWRSLHTGVYISPVAQMLSTFGKLLATDNATMEGADTTGLASLPFTLAPAGLGGGPVPCIQAAAICTGAEPTLLALNRCAQAVPLTVSSATVCRGHFATWNSIRIFRATVAEQGPGHAWAKLGSHSWPMVPVMRGGGNGTVSTEPFALSVIQLRKR